MGDTALEKGVEGGGTRWTRIVRDLGCVLVATMSARPPPPLLPGMLHGGGVGGLKKKSTKSSGRSVPDVSKAIVRYLKGRRSELLEQDQENATVQSALETMDRHLAEWGVLAESVDSGAGGSQKRFNLVQVEDHSWSFDHNNAVPIPCAAGRPRSLPVRPVRRPSRRCVLPALPRGCLLGACWGCLLMYQAQVAARRPMPAASKASSRLRDT